MGKGSPETTARAFFGRRKGKHLRVGQAQLVETLLPRLRVPARSEIDPASLFSPSQRAIVLEIGFGGGEHLVAKARADPATGFIGCEPFANGVAKLLAAIEREGLNNIRIFDADATELFPRLSAQSIERIYLLYPDPWPKRRQRKRRLISEDTLAGLARVMRPGAELRFATDIDDYAGWVLARVLRSEHWRWAAERPDDWRRPWRDWPGTRYEAKALREGRRPIYLSFARV